jgi:hypothetical protein
MAVFPSAEWLDDYVRCINASEEFADAGETLNADISYVFEAEPELNADREIWCRARFGDGRCHWGRYDIAPEESEGSTWIIRAPYSSWKDVIQGRLDPMEGMLDGDLAVTGHLPTLLRHIRAANELVNLAAQVSSSFVDEEPAVST